MALLKYNARALNGRSLQGWLLARPQVGGKGTTIGSQPLGLGGKRDGLLYVPAGLPTNRPAPLVVMLHDAGGGASDSVAPLVVLADAAGLILLAPDSRGGTWDLIKAALGPDVVSRQGPFARLLPLSD